MGARQFCEFSHGKSAEEAFARAKSNAFDDSGHGGYSGTIAEKSCFEMATTEVLMDTLATQLADELIDTRFSDKWGPVGCIEVTVKANQVRCFLFFGWASS